MNQQCSFKGVRPHQCSFPAVESINKCNKPSLTRSAIASTSLRSLDTNIFTVPSSTSSLIVEHLGTPSSSASSTTQYDNFFPSSIDSNPHTPENQGCEFQCHALCHESRPVVLGLARSLSVSLDCEEGGEDMEASYEIGNDVMDFFLSFEFDELS